MGKGNVYVLDAAVIESGYVSGHIRTRDYVLKKAVELYAVAAHFIPIPSKHSR